MNVDEIDNEVEKKTNGQGIYHKDIIKRFNGFVALFATFPVHTI